MKLKYSNPGFKTDEAKGIPIRFSFWFPFPPKFLEKIEL
jgi:hypothetical protein